ncbi:MAG: septation protein A [Zetaproteobacteria bacterium]|nr:MAG: septation protein A [Zetaproteobacteria bacterium]
MKLLSDFLPVLLFFTAYKLYGIYVATAVLIVASLVQTLWHRLHFGRFENNHLITLALVLVFGGATLMLHDELFIKWKPTVINWLFALLFLASRWFGGQSLLERMLGDKIELGQRVWRRLNLAWIAFFIAMGGANLYVAFHFDTDTWVNFKLFGMMGLTFAFIIGQSLYLARHLEAVDK